MYVCPIFLPNQLWDIHCSCPIKCKKENGERYPFDSLNRTCGCPVCKCKCLFACHIGDVCKITLSKVHLPKDSANVHSAEINGRMTHVLRNVFKQAFEVGFNTLHDNILREASTTPSRKLSPTRIEKLKDHSMYVMCQKEAVDICSSSPNITMEERKYWQEYFGKLSTICKLPAGDMFDTKSIPTVGKHGYNNKL